MTDVDYNKFYEGDDVVFEQLVNRHSPHLLVLIRRFADTDDAAKDLLQETWVRIYTQRRHFSASGSLLGWMLSVCRNVCLTAERSNRARSRREAEYSVQHEGDSFVYDSSLVHDAVAALPERQRDAVVCRLIEGRSTRETARLLDCAEGTVKALLHQGVCTLRKQMKEAGHE
jgi:RNA polymerase sigma factor (sigma-70 family)